MMRNIDELKARHKELMVRLKEEKDLMDQGRGDNLAYFMVKEELLEVNALLRQFSPGYRVGSRARHAPVSDEYDGNSRSDYQQFKDWERENFGFDDEIDEGRAYMKEILEEGIESLSEKQRSVLTRWCNGESVNTIAEKDGVSASTVSRTLKRAKATAVKYMEPRLMLAKKRVGNKIDMSDPAIAKIVLDVLSDKQAVAIYLYYGEWLALREIADLIGVGHSTICRTIQRGLRNIRDAVGEDITTVENVQYLDEIAFAIYCRIEDVDEFAKEYERARTFARTNNKKPTPGGPSLRTRGNINSEAPIRMKSSYSVKFNRGHVPDTAHGSLLKALLDRQKRLAEAGKLPPGFPVFSWLKALFGELISRSKARKNNGF